MTYEEARNAIQAHVASNWTGTPGGTVAYDNLPFTPPVGSPWVRLSIQNESGVQAGFGGSAKRFRRQGTVKMQIFVVEGDGAGGVTQLADQAVLLFEGTKLSGGLRFTQVGIREIGVESGWFGLDVSAAFSFDDVH